MQQLVEALPPGQTAHDNPLITSMVFHNRLEALLKNLRTGAYFNGQKTIFIMRCIEYPASWSSRQVYVVARDPSKRAICRLEQGRLGEGEKWYLRIILLNRSIRSFQDAKLVNGVRYPTFQEAALSSNFIKDGDECLCAFREALLINIPRQKRALFTILTLQGYPASIIFNDPVLQRSMYDFDPSKDDSELQQMMLEYVQSRLVTEGKLMAIYGLPMPIQRMTESEIHEVGSLFSQRGQNRFNMCQHSFGRAELPE